MTRRPVSPVKISFCLQPGVAAALCALVLLLGASEPTRADDAKPLTGILITAGADVSDPSFSDSVVLVMNNVGPAPAGVIINRPTQISVSQLFPDLKSLTKLHDRVYFGGPVEFGTRWFLFWAARAPA